MTPVFEQREEMALKRLRDVLKKTAKDSNEEKCIEEAYENARRMNQKLIVASSISFVIAHMPVTI